MAGLLQYQGSEIPESVRRAAQFELDARKAQQSRLPLSVEGSGIPESVRKAAQNAIEKGAMPRIPNAPVEAPGGWTDGARNLSAADAKALLTKGGSLLGSAGKAAGGIGAVYELGSRLNDTYGTGAWDRAQDIATRYDTRKALEKDPGLQDRALSTVDRTVGQAMEGVRGLMNPAGFKGTNTKYSDLPPKQEMPMEPAKVAAVEAVTQAAPEVEAGRQRIQAGALKGLQTGQVHVSDMAKAVVEADEQRAGTPMKSEEKAQAVTAEIAAMKTMDKAQLSEYVSYALIAGGLLASVLDKSGQTGQAFHQSLNAQLDRNLAAGKMQATIANNAAKLALEERKVGNTEKDTASKIESRGSTAEYQKGSLAVAEKNAGVNQQNANTRSRAASVAEAQGNQRLGLMGAANELRERDVNSKIAAREAKINQSTQKGVAPSVKDATGFAEEYMKGQGLKPDAAVTTALGTRIPTIMKNYPELSAQQALEIAQDELGDSVMTEDNLIMPNKTRFRKPKE